MTTVDYGVYKRVGAGKGTGVAAHAPRGWGVFAVVILSRQDANTVSMFFLYRPLEVVQEVQGRLSVEMAPEKQLMRC